MKFIITLGLIIITTSVFSQGSFDSTKVSKEIFALLKNGFTDPRDSNHYNVIKIGKQIWMAENLRYLPDTVHCNSDFIKACYYLQPAYGVYGYDGSDVTEAKTEAHYNTYGVLYNKYVLNESICPAGWHVPTYEEWEDLINFIVNDGHNGAVGIALKAQNFWNSNGNGTDDYGFRALPGGYRCQYYGTFSGEGYFGNWWCTSEGLPSYAFFWYLLYNSKRINSKGRQRVQILNPIALSLLISLNLINRLLPMAFIGNI